MADVKWSNNSAFPINNSLDGSELIVGLKGGNNFKTQLSAGILNFTQQNLLPTGNVRYIAVTGDDVNGNGSITNPWATPQGANNNITDNSNENTYLIVALSGFWNTEGAQLQLKPYIEFDFQDAYMQWSNTIVLDPSWADLLSDPIVAKQNQNKLTKYLKSLRENNVKDVGTVKSLIEKSMQATYGYSGFKGGNQVLQGITLDTSAIPGLQAIFYIGPYTQSQDATGIEVNVLGNAEGNSVYLFRDGIDSFWSGEIVNLQDCGGVITNCGFFDCNLTSTISLEPFCVFYNNLSLSNLSITNDADGGFLAFCTTTIWSNVYIYGTGGFYEADAVSYVYPNLQNGATVDQISLLSNSGGTALDGNFTPTNFSLVSGNWPSNSMTAVVAGINAALGPGGDISLQDAYNNGTPGQQGSITLTSDNLNPITSLNSYADGNQEHFIAVNMTGENLWGYAFQAPNSISTITDFAHIYANVENNLDGSESGSLSLYTASYGTLTQAMILDGSSQDVGIFWPTHIPNGTQTYFSLSLLTTDVTYTAALLGYCVVSDDVSAHNIDLPATYYSTNADDSLQIQTQGTYAVSITPDAGVTINGSNSVITIPIYTLATLRLVNAASKAWILTEESTSTGGGGTVNVTDDNSTNAIMYPTWVTANSGDQPVYVSSLQLQWNPGTQTFTFWDNTNSSNINISTTSHYAKLQLVANLEQTGDPFDFGAYFEWFDSLGEGVVFQIGYLPADPNNTFEFYDGFNDTHPLQMDQYGLINFITEGFTAVYSDSPFWQFSGVTAANQVLFTNDNNYLSGSNNFVWSPDNNQLTLLSPNTNDQIVMQPVNGQVSLQLISNDGVVVHSLNKNSSSQAALIEFNDGTSSSGYVWQVGMFGDSTYNLNIYDYADSSYPMKFITGTGLVNLPNLSPSMLVATDASNNLISVSTPVGAASYAVLGYSSNSNTTAFTNPSTYTPIILNTASNYGNTSNFAINISTGEITYNGPVPATIRISCMTAGGSLFSGQSVYAAPAVNVGSGYAVYTYLGMPSTWGPAPNSITTLAIVPVSVTGAKFQMWAQNTTGTSPIVVGTMYFSVEVL